MKNPFRFTDCCFFFFFLQIDNFRKEKKKTSGIRDSSKTAVFIFHINPGGYSGAKRGHSNRAQAPHAFLQPLYVFSAGSSQICFSCGVQ